MTVPRKKTQRDLRGLEKAEKAAQLDKFDTILDMEKYELAPEIEEEEEGEIEYVEGGDIEMGDMDNMEGFEGFGDEDGLEIPF
ncbi:Protein MAK16 [Hordeum vulgare]|nr:Protein MAK16 [Hordeum vulgare]